MSDTVEKPIMRVYLYFIFRQSRSGVRYTDKQWNTGMVYLTNENIWFSTKDRYRKIPLSGVISIHREEVIMKGYPQYKILAIDYDDGSAFNSTALLAGPHKLINELKRKILTLADMGLKISYKPTDIEDRLLIALYFGIRDWDALRVLLDRNTKEIMEGMNNLKDWGLVEGAGKLTQTGLEYARRLAETRESA